MQIKKEQHNAHYLFTRNNAGKFSYQRIVCHV